jgi:predicted RNase H-like HicB family nuclease
VIDNGNPKGLALTTLDATGCSLTGGVLENEAMEFTIDLEQEEDGRWIAEVIGVPGVLAYGRTPDEAITKVEALRLRVRVEDEAAKRLLRTDLDELEHKYGLRSEEFSQRYDGGEMGDDADFVEWNALFQEIAQGLSEPMDYNVCSPHSMW